MPDTPTPTTKRAAPATSTDFVKREISAMNRIITALGAMSPTRRRAIMSYINGLFSSVEESTADTLKSIEGRIPERPNVKLD